MAEVFDYPFVPVHRDLLDHALLRLSGNGMKALLVVMRKTVGWADPNDSSKRKMQDDISFSQFRAAMGGSNATIQEALDEVVKAGYVIHIDRGPRRVHAYRLNLAFNTDSDGGISPEQEAEVPTHACKWCGRLFSRNGLKAHEWRCREKPGETVTESVKDASVTETVTDGAGKSVTETVTATVTVSVKDGGESVTESVNTKEILKKGKEKEGPGENENFEEAGDSPGTAKAVSADAETPPVLPGFEKPEPPPPKKKTRGPLRSGEPHRIYEKLVQILKNPGLPAEDSRRAIKEMLEMEYEEGGETRQIMPGDVLNFATYCMDMVPQVEWFRERDIVSVNCWYLKKNIVDWARAGKKRKYRPPPDGEAGGNGRKASAPSVSSEEDFWRQVEAEKAGGAT